VQATGEQIQRYDIGGPVPMRWQEEAWRNPPRTTASVIREIARSRLQGHGIEFGPGTSPMPAPLDRTVQYADFLPEEGVRARKYEAAGDDFARLDYVMGLEDPHLIQDKSVDFVVAAHVIEHVRNPLRAFEAVYRKLKAGG
jgi:SAM-dependent methyltransferase